VGARFPGEPRRRRALAGDLDNIVLQALRKEPERRYPSVDALAADVRRHLADQPVVARPDRLGYRARKFVRRHRAGVAAVALAALALVAGTAIALWQAARARHERDRKSTRLNSSHANISYAVFCLKKKKHKYKHISHVKKKDTKIKR